MGSELEGWRFNNAGCGLKKLNMSMQRHDEHFMNRERWFGKTAVQTATDWGTEASLTPFQAISGNGVFGADGDDEAQVLGTDDTPVITDKQFFMLHKLLVLTVSAATVYILRIVYGTGTMADAESAGQYSDVGFIRESGVGRGTPVTLKMPMLAAGTKVWIRAKNATDNATIDFLIGLHEHD